MTTLHIKAGAVAAPVVTKTTTYTILATDDTVLCDAAGGAFTVTLPSAATTTGRQYRIKKIDATVNIVTIATTSSQTIDGVTTRTLTLPKDMVTVESDGSNWRVLEPNPNADRAARTFARQTWR